MTPETALAVSLAYAAALLVTAVMARRDPLMLRVALAMLTNLALVWLWALVSGIDDAWWFFLAIDALTARVVLRQPAGRWQAVIGLLYVIQCLMHVRYGIGYRDDAITSVYLDTLTAIGWGQLVALIGGATHGRSRHVNGNHLAGGYHRAATQSGGSSMGQTR